jgi:hypothetical protein
MTRECTFFFRKNDYTLWEKLDRIPSQEFYNVMADILVHEGNTEFPKCYGTDKRASMHYLMVNCDRDYLNEVIPNCFEEYGRKGDVLNCLIIANSTFEVDDNAFRFFNGVLKNSNFERVKSELSKEKVKITGYTQGSEYVDVRLTSKSTHYEAYEVGEQEKVDAKEFDQNIEIRCYPSLGLSFVTRHFKSQEKLTMYVSLIVQALGELSADYVSVQALVMQEEQLLIIQSGLRGEMRGGTLKLSNEPVKLTFDGRKKLEAKSSVLLNLAERSGNYQSIEFLFYDKATNEKHRMRILGADASVVTTGEVQPSVVNDLVQHLVVAREMQDFMRDPNRTLYHLVQGIIHTAPEAMKSRLVRDLTQEFEKMLQDNVNINSRDKLWLAYRSASFNILADMAVGDACMPNVENHDYVSSYQLITQLIRLFRNKMVPLKNDELNSLLNKFTNLISGCSNPFSLMQEYVKQKGEQNLVDPLASICN